MWVSRSKSSFFFYFLLTPVKKWAREDACTFLKCCEWLHLKTQQLSKNYTFCQNYTFRSKFKNPFGRRHSRVPRAPTCRVTWLQTKKISGNNHTLSKNIFLTQKWVSRSKCDYFFAFFLHSSVWELARDDACQFLRCCAK